jgi:hypothetical protein
MSVSNGSGGIEGAQYLSFALGVMGLSAALALVFSVIVVCESWGSVMSFIRTLLGRLSAYGDHAKGWWHLTKWVLTKRELQEMCVNCGPLSKGKLLVRCRMWSRCTESQVREIEAGGETPEGIISGRPLCIACAEANKYTCWVCEIEAASEKKR